jgi:hypothetical protein
VKYGRVAENASINATIYRCFEYISEPDAQTFVRAFGRLPHDGDQIMHAFRELILGGFLASRGQRVAYDQRVNGQTPDWSIFEEDHRLRCIVELVNFHIDRATEDEIALHAQARRFWSGWPDPQKRLYQSIWDKASKYKRLVEQIQVAYVIALFGEFVAAVDLDDVRQCLFAADKGLFPQYPEVSGLIFFVENGGQYAFTYLPNPLAKRPFDLPFGEF